MTVCVAALAARSRALVCIADKSVAYGEKIQWDSDSTKLFHLKPSGAVVMFSGCERDITEVLSRSNWELTKEKPGNYCRTSVKKPQIF
jgi:hypothetical protein